MNAQQRRARVALLSVVSNTALTGAKLVVGLLIGSVSVISEAIHSGMDLVASVMAWLAVRTADRPADQNHPFGHGKVENISGTVEALLILVAGVWIIAEAVARLLRPQPMEHVGWGVLVMLLSAVVNQMVSGRLFRVGVETDSAALKADGWHLRTDVWTSAGVLAGLAVVWILSQAAPDRDFGWIDPVAAIAVALLILRASWKLTTESGRDLLDASLSGHEQQLIRDCIARRFPAVRAFHHLRTRKGGAQRFVEFHLVVTGTMSVEESHGLADDITADVQAHLPGTRVTVHVEPCDGRCQGTCAASCLVPAAERPAPASR